MFAVIAPRKLWPCELVMKDLLRFTVKAGDNKADFALESE